VNVLQKLLSKKIEENRAEIYKRLGKDKSFDVINRDFKIARHEATLVFIDGFIKDKLMLVLTSLMEAKEEEMSVDFIEKILDKKLPYHEIEIVDSIDKVIDQILKGPQVLLIDGINKAIVIDGRSWTSRSPEEPELEKSTRGPSDGFVETMLFNVNAVRRRIRDPNFRAEVLEVGTRSKNDVALVYIDDIIEHDLLNKVKEKINTIKIDGLPLADKTIEEIIIGKTINPLPKVRYTERPDNVAAHILEGHLAIIVDNSPTALVLPAPFLSHIQTLEVFRQGALIGTYLSFVRLIAILFSVFLPAVWLILATNPELLPESLSFIGTKQESSIGLGIQFILASFGIDLIRMASTQTPNTLSTSLSLIGALILGDFAVKVGLFTPEVILYLAISAISNFSIPGYELALVLKMVRFLLLIAVVLFNIKGFLIVIAFVFIWFVMTKSFDTHYLWPIIPFNYSALKAYIFRQNIYSLTKKRPFSNKKNKSRMNKEK